MKKLLVGSVYAPCDRNQVWLSLQKRFLGESSKCDFTHGVFLNRVPADMFHEHGCEILGSTEQWREDMCEDHAFGLNAIMQAFMARLDEYENFLILDSDAFPYQDNWVERLLNWMKADDRLGEKLFAAPPRVENLDTFPHPCCCFIRGELLRRMGDRFCFDVAPHTNLAGYQFRDVGCALPTDMDGHHVWLPLLRTNVWTPHPIMAALYGAVFYHHGAGSRAAEFRSVALRSYDNYIARHMHGDTERQLYQEISRNPRIFIRQLMGG